MNPTELRALIRERAPHGIWRLTGGSLTTWVPVQLAPGQTRAPKRGPGTETLDAAQLEKLILECECFDGRIIVGPFLGAFHPPDGYQLCPSCTEIRGGLGL